MKRIAMLLAKVTGLNLSCTLILLTICVLSEGSSINLLMPPIFTSTLTALKYSYIWKIKNNFVKVGKLKKNPTQHFHTTMLAVILKFLEGLVNRLG
jgi:hypothetical protein